MKIDYRNNRAAGSNGAERGEERGARLATSLSGTNLARAGDYNQRIVLQAVRISEHITRAEIVEQTGLTVPTIANITKRLLDRGLILNAGKRVGGRGQPALRFAINPDGCFGIGVNIDRDHVSVVALDLAGNVRARETREIAFPMPDQVVAHVREVVDAILASGAIDADRVLGIGVALPDGLGSVALPHRPEGYELWNEVDVVALFAAVMPWPVYCDNDAAAAAIGEAQFGAGLLHSSFFYLLLTAGLGGGLVIDGGYYRGATGRSGEIGFLPSSGGHMLQDSVSLSALYAMLEADGLSIASPAELEQPTAPVATVIDRWIDRAATDLVAPLTAVNCLVNPEAVLIGGRLPADLIERLAVAVNERLAAEGAGLPSLAPVIRADLAADAPAVGAAILPFNDAVFPSDNILMKVGHD
ncbi:ROK family transcriptional regulator [Sphingomonas abietis]|uniref:ROK family transcriptional regulator n=1 Tax=Sphingomonas abietis TaxID=3012344 RepID=A0ABY7NKF8_9SPHN|nr:ROK family transcriptional regulator [Sphingomonas abietis]WBO21285.1 ROK family transcriptional regulator [Sphingomonas abietis]